MNVESYNNQSYFSASLAHILGLLFRGRCTALFLLYLCPVCGRDTTTELATSRIVGPKWPG
jgi:hypothetical protein